MEEVALGLAALAALVVVEASVLPCVVRSRPEEDQGEEVSEDWTESLGHRLFCRCRLAEDLLDRIW